jgi:dTDP-4-dehydrorhamnose 3,5-epimerase
MIEKLNQLNAFVALEDSDLVFHDDRGYVKVLYESNDEVIKKSFSKKGVFRGLHWQNDLYPQTKVIRVVKGEILDFVVNVRDFSGDLYYRTINPSDGWFLIHSKFAHGFYASQDSLFEYICFGKYNEDAEECFSISDILKEKLDINDIHTSKKDEKGKKLLISKIINKTNK